MLSLKPVYNGTRKLSGLQQKVTVYFDDYGIPHIYGESETDVYRALGYVHAQERLFQMEMLRRLSSGRLAEVFGNKLLSVDRFFRMLGFNVRTAQSEKDLLEDHSPLAEAAKAYVDGINQFIQRGKLPVEFRLLRIRKELFTVKDIFLIADYMTLNFQMAFRTDPLLSLMKKKLGEQYLKDLGISQVPFEPDTILMVDTMTTRDTSQILNSSEDMESSAVSSLMDQLDQLLPFKAWSGSNAWVLGKEKSRSGKILFENDTHTGHQQPAIWYEAHLNYPGMNFYGNFIAGFPFAPLGHTDHHTWGLTIFENDDLDFYSEHVSKADSNLYYHDGEWKKMTLRKEIIQVKDSAEFTQWIRETVHGPVCSDVTDEYKSITSRPVSACWTFLKFPDNLTEVSYNFSHAKNINEFRSAVSELIAPGLNVLYGDSSDNYAWWAAGRLVKRPIHVNSLYIQDGTGSNDWLGYYSFDVNPHSINPEAGFVYSANQPPDPFSENNYPGYYLPQDRAIRIRQLLNNQKQFSINEMMKIASDVTNPVAAELANFIADAIEPVVALKSGIHQQALHILRYWNGNHSMNQVAPVIYYRCLYHSIHSAWADETGEKEFELFLKTHSEKNALKPFFQNDSSLWWDNISTPEKETKSIIITGAFEKTITELISQLGPDPDLWKWGKVHSVEFENVVGKKKPLNKLFNIGPFSTAGGIETINQQSFPLNDEKIFKVNHGPSLRRLLDFSNPDNGLSINPTGQSGNFMSNHYSDQTDMYVGSRFRKEMMNEKEIKTKCKNKLVFNPR